MYSTYIYNYTHARASISPHNTHKHNLRLVPRLLHLLSNLLLALAPLRLQLHLATAATAATAAVATASTTTATCASINSLPATIQSKYFELACYLPSDVAHGHTVRRGFPVASLTWCGCPAHYTDPLQLQPGYPPAHHSSACTTVAPSPFAIQRSPAPQLACYDPTQ